MREYEKSHPWITFSLNLAQIPPATWMLLGEIHSKCQHLSGVPLRPDVAEQLHRIYLAKGVVATTAIEGNTLSEEQVQRQLDNQLDLPKSKKYLAQETQNIIDLCNQIVAQALDGHSEPLTSKLIMGMNAAVLRDLQLSEEQIVPGKVRKHVVGVGKYRGAPAGDCEYLLDRLCDWLNLIQSRNKEEPLAPALPVLCAVLAHLYIAWIHPFGDGNGRTARMIEFKILIDAGIPTPAAHLLSNHFNETRSEYYRQLQHSSEAKDVIAFINYAVQGFVDGLHEQLKRVRTQQFDVAWRNFVHERFRGEKSESARRRRDLVLEMSRLDPQADRTLKGIATASQQLLGLYGKLDQRTLQRDLNTLQKEGLVLHENGQWRPRVELILAFLAPVKR